MAEKIARVLNRHDDHSTWQLINPVLMSGEIVSSKLIDGSIKFKIGNGSTYNKTPFVEDQFFSKEEVEGMMTIINNIQIGKYSLIQASEEEPEDLGVSIWYEIEPEDNNGL